MGPGHQIQPEPRSAAHGVDIGGRIGGCDATPGVGIVDHWSEEIGGRDQGAAFPKTPHRGVVAGLCAHDQVLVDWIWQRAHDLRQLGWPELAGSTGAVGVGREPSGLGVHGSDATGP